MKKLLLSMASLLLCGGMAMAQDVTLNVSDATDIKGTDVPEVPASGNSNGTGRHIQPLESLSINGYAFTFAQNEGSNAPAYYYPMSTNENGDKTIRIYKQNSFTMTAPAGVTFTKVVFVNGSTKTTVYNGEKAGTFTYTLPSDGSNFRAVTIEVTFDGGSDPQPGTKNYTLTESTPINLLGEDDTECDFTFDNVKLSEGITYVWAWKGYNEKYYLNGSAYNKQAFEAEAYAVSPVLDLTGVTDALVSFDHAARFQTTLKNLCGFVVREEGAKDWTSIAIPEWPEAGAWTWANSGEMDLKAFAGKKIQIGFKYGSTAEGADTWEIKNLKMTGKGAGIEGVEAGADAEAVYYNLQGVRVANPEKGLFIVVKGGKSQKVVF